MIRTVNVERIIRCLVSTLQAPHTAFFCMGGYDSRKYPLSARHYKLLHDKLLVFGKATAGGI